MTERTIETGRGLVRVVADAEALAHAAADLFAETTTEAAAERGRAFVALSGGSTPQRMGELLAAAPHRDRVPWERLELFWGDERWVPSTSPESNAGVARRAFVDRVPIPAAQVHPFPTPDEAATPAAAAAAYAATLRRAFGGGGLPRFDLVLLGMGDDGHTASLFPRTAALAERSALAVANVVPKLDADRLTLTAPVLNAGRRVVVLVAGAGKAEALRAVLRGPADPDTYPSQLIRPDAGHALWLVDEAAVRLL